MARFEETRQIIETRYFNHIRSNPLPHNAKTFLEGRQFLQPTEGSWVVLMIDDSASALQGFQQDLRKTSGMIRFKIFTQHGDGTKRVRDIADTLNDALSYSAGNNGLSEGTLYIRAGSLRKVTDDDNGYLSYVLDLTYDYYTS